MKREIVSITCDRCDKNTKSSTSVSFDTNSGTDAAGSTEHRSVEVDLCQECSKAFILYLLTRVYDQTLGSIEKVNQEILQNFFKINNIKEREIST